METPGEALMGETKVHTAVGLPWAGFAMFPSWGYKAYSQQEAWALEEVPQRPSVSPSWPQFPHPTWRSGSPPSSADGM